MLERASVGRSAALIRGIGCAPRVAHRVEQALPRAIKWTACARILLLFSDGDSAMKSCLPVLLFAVALTAAPPILADQTKAQEVDAKPAAVTQLKIIDQK